MSVSIIDNLNLIPSDQFYKCILQYCSYFTISNRLATSSIELSPRGEQLIKKLSPFLIEEKMIRFSDSSHNDILYKYRIDVACVKTVMRLVPRIEEWELPDSPELFLAYRSDGTLFSEIAPWENLYTFSVTKKEFSELTLGILYSYQHLLAYRESK